MNSQSAPVSTQMHPLMMGAAVSVIVVSMLGAAAITGILPSSHGQAGAPAASRSLSSHEATQAALATPAASTALTAQAVSSTRYMTPDGQLLELVPATQRVAPVRPVRVAQVEERAEPVPARARKAVHRPAQERLEPVRRSYAQHSDNAVRRTSQPAYQRTYQPAYQPTSQRAYQPTYQPTHQPAQQPGYQPVHQPAYQAPVQQPVRSYVGDMSPVGTGVGAVVGGLIGNQIGGGSGKKLATVAGVLLGGYAGNEVAHNRSPLPW